MTLETLKTAFGDCKHTGISKCPVNSSYEVVSYPRFFVFDDDDRQPVRIINEETSPHQLKVKNDSSLDICLVKTDKCLFTDTHKKCDCILFSHSNAFLVEISNARNRKEKRQDAVRQLGATIDLLKDHKINLDTHQTKAIICFRSGKTRPIQASFNTQRGVFLQKYNISLEEGNEIAF